MHILGASAKAALTPEEPVEGVTNYYLGSRVITGVPHYAQVRVRGIRDGIDLLYRSSAQELEYDFILRPGADPKSIRLHFSGALSPALDENGDLLFKSGGAELRQRKPKVWQEDAQGRRDIACRYVLERNGNVRLALGGYNRSRDLVIDPVLSYSTFLGGSLGADSANGIAVDGSGDAYITGSTTSSDFPVTSGSFHGVNGSSDVFVTRLNPTGTALIYSTFIGGSVNDIATAIAVNAGNAYISGSTDSNDFPVTIGQNHQGAFAIKLNSSGVLVYSTVLEPLK